MHNFPNFLMRVHESQSRGLKHLILKDLHFYAISLAELIIKKKILSVIR